MTISASYAPPTYTGNGVTTAFSTVFPFMDASDLVVTKITIATEAEEVLVLNTGYTVSGGSGAAGTVTVSPAISSSYQLRIERVTPRTQTTDFQDTGEFPIGTLETRLDRIVLAVQEVAAEASSALTLAEAAASEEYVDDAIEDATTSLEAQASAAASSASTASSQATAAAASAAAAEAALDAILTGGALADAPVSPAMQPVVAAATLGDARTELGLGGLAVLGLASNISWTGNHTWGTGTATFNNGMTVAGTAALATVTASGNVTVTGTSTLNGATTVDDTLAVTGAATVAAVTASGLVAANAGLNVAGAALNTPTEVDVASAGTVDLDAAASNKVRITGTTAITAITLTNGRVRFLRFAGILTLTNGASLILPGGANITTAAGDTCIVMGEAAGVVRVVDYCKADGTPVAGGSGKVAQVVRATWSTYTAFTDSTPVDNTIPQSGEGAERFTASITPTNASSTLLIDVELQTTIDFSVGAGDVGRVTVVGHLHRDSNANAVGAGIMSEGISNATASTLTNYATGSIRIHASVSASSTSATTFKVRSGRADTGTVSSKTTAHNGVGGALMGGVMVSGITITEILP